jgi:hypothetical protein
MRPLNNATNPTLRGKPVAVGYLRTTMLERRRKVVADWAAFLASEGAAATVVPFKGKRR